MPPLPIIQCLWIGNRLSALERLSLSSFLHHGHAVHLYVYGDVAKVPDGVVLRDAAAILPANRIFTYQNRNSYAGFANLFRYKLLCEQGGCWADADMICLAPIAHRTEHLFVSEHIGDARRRRGWLKRLITRKAPPLSNTNGGHQQLFHPGINWISDYGPLLSYGKPEGPQKDQMG